MHTNLIKRVKKSGWGAFMTDKNTALDWNSITASSSQKILPRDVFLNEVYRAAKTEEKIYFMSADFGAKALDQFRDEIPSRFIHAGICEQNMIDMAAGFAQEGKIPYVYAMCPFVSLRAYEQVKVALASMNLPCTILGVGAGFSYDDAGPTHYATEDVTCMRALGNIEILCPSDTATVLHAAKISYQDPKLRYIRLDRLFLPDVYSQGDHRFATDGISEIVQGAQGGTLIISTGYMFQKAMMIQKSLSEAGMNVGVADLYRIKPIDPKILSNLLSRYEKIVTLEEHFLSGGIGAAIVEAMADAGILKRVLRLGLKDEYRLENGGREHILKLAGLDLATLKEKVRSFVQA